MPLMLVTSGSAADACALSPMSRQTQALSQSSKWGDLDLPTPTASPMKAKPDFDFDTDLALPGAMLTDLRLGAQGVGGDHTGGMGSMSGGRRSGPSGGRALAPAPAQAADAPKELYSRSSRLRKRKEQRKFFATGEARGSGRGRGRGRGRGCGRAARGH